MVDVPCASDTTDLISKSAFCNVATRTAANTQCCVQQCIDGFALNGVTDSSETNSGAAKLNCDEGLVVDGAEQPCRHLEEMCKEELVLCFASNLGPGIG